MRIRCQEPMDQLSRPIVLARRLPMALDRPWPLELDRPAEQFVGTDIEDDREVVEHPYIGHGTTAFDARIYIGGTLRAVGH